MHERRFEGDISRLRFPERTERLEVERVVDLCLENGEPRSMLDVGTGTGLFAQAFSKRGLEVSGVDVNPEMLVEAQKFVPKGSFREGTAEALPYQDSSFDLVFLGLVLHETDDLPKALLEAQRVATKRVCILEWPYREQPFGPPIADRLKPEDLADQFKRAEFRSWNRNDLLNTTLYLLEK
jgi:ubiquinone/menaquinone biosynthesis C-methylase UbiE